MKTIQELNALLREIDASIVRLTRDEQFHNLIEHADAKIEELRKRRALVANIINNFPLYDWVFNSNTSVKRSNLVDPNSIKIVTEL